MYLHLKKEKKSSFIYYIQYYIRVYDQCSWVGSIILARQVFQVTSGAMGQMTLVVVVSIGIGIMITVGLLRIVFKIPINRVITFFYGTIFLLVIISPESFLGIAFDSGGVASSPMTATFYFSFCTRGCKWDGWGRCTIGCFLVLSVR